MPQKKILLLATGGTIACKPTSRGVLAPAISAGELLQFVPELEGLCQIDTLQLYDLDSTNIGPEHWCGMARAIRDRYDAYDGFVIAHGTDTMAYTAAALSYMIQNTAKPIVLTGSQKSIYNRDTDARNNLLHAFAYAVSAGAWGVQIVFDNLVILGTRARKVRSKSLNAFSSIDYPETAVFRDDRLIRFLPAAASICRRCTSRRRWTRRCLCSAWCPAWVPRCLPRSSPTTMRWSSRALVWAACPAARTAHC